MKYTVLFTNPALDDLDDAYDWLVTRTTFHAPTWYNGLLDAVLSLEESALRCPQVPEADGSELTRQLLYGDKRHAFRILFRVRGDQVLILHIRRAARQS